jgi:hypothetical protein
MPLAAGGHRGLRRVEFAEVLHRLALARYSPPDRDDGRPYPAHVASLVAMVLSLLLYLQPPPLSRMRRASVVWGGGGRPRWLQ